MLTSAEQDPRGFDSQFDATGALCSRSANNGSHERGIEDLTKDICRLPDLDQLVLSLWYKESLTPWEISSVLDVPIDRVLSVHSSALAQLRTSGIYHRDPVAA